jgi:hypothetical protein
MSLKIIDGTPPTISKYLRERERKCNLCGHILNLKGECINKQCWKFKLGSYDTKWKEKK